MKKTPINHGTLILAKFRLSREMVICRPVLRLRRSKCNIYPAKSDIHPGQNKIPTRMWCGRKEDADWHVGAFGDVIQEVFRAGPEEHLLQQYQTS